MNLVGSFMPNIDSAVGKVCRLLGVRINSDRLKLPTDKYLNQGHAIGTIQ